MMNKIGWFCFFAGIAMLAAGCHSGSSAIVEKDLLPKEDRLRSSYFMLMDFTSLYDQSVQRRILTNTTELLMIIDLMAPSISEADYIILAKLQEFKIISASARFSAGYLAGTDIIETDVVVVDPATLHTGKFADLFSQTRAKPIPGLLEGLTEDQKRLTVEVQRIAQVLTSMDEAHLMKKTVRTTHRKPATVQVNDFVRIHSEEIIKSIFGK